MIIIASSCMILKSSVSSYFLAKFILLDFARYDVKVSAVKLYPKSSLAYPIIVSMFALYKL